MDQNFSAIDLTFSVSDPTIILSKALANRNIQDFRAALKVGAQPLALDDNHNSVFEEALQTAGCVEFVEECFKAGCNPHQINTYFNKSVINYASDSRDPQIINAVLAYKGVNVNFKYAELTPLNSLAKALNPENIDNVFKCLQILLQYGASPNLADQREMTPLHYIVKNTKIDELKKLEIIKLFLVQPNIDIYTYRLGELRDILAEKYPELKLPAKQESYEITYHMLLTHIRKGDMEKFKQQFMAYQGFPTEDESLQLLSESIQWSAYKAFDLLMDSGVDYNKNLDANNTALEIAIVYGNWYALERLLQQPDIKIRSNDYPLCLIVRKLNDSSSQVFCDYWKCFDVLLNCDKIDINQMDKSRSTALHYAVKYRNNKAIKLLLNKGADISVKNRFNDMPIDGMLPEVLEEHLDSCISSNGLKPGEEEYEIIINFKNLMPEKKLQQRFKEDMAPIEFMANTKDFLHLLQHPVITSYLCLKWHKLLVVFYVNFLLYLFYAISGICHVVLMFRLTEYQSVMNITRNMTWLGICYLILREIIQFIICPRRYFRSLTNYMEILLIILSVITCAELKLPDDYLRRIAVVTILLAAVELCLLVGSLPVTSISTHMLMLEAVCKSFLKSFLFYSIFVITFTLCFYIMSDHKPSTESNKEDEFHQFTNPLVAFTKTIVMLTGEFDADNFNDNSFHLIIFLIFVFFITIIMFNLLNGLAVSDTQVIKAQAELNLIICRTQLLTRYEQLFIERVKKTKSLKCCQPFRAISQCFLNLFPDYKTGSQISILPNNNNTILLPKKISEQIMDNQEETALTTDEKIIKRPNLLRRCIAFIVAKSTIIDHRTVQLAMAVLARKSETNIENRLMSMEQKLEEILKCMSEQKS